MEAYPGPYVEHNLPLVLLSGLGDRQESASSGLVLPRQEFGTKLQGGSPECSGERAQALLEQFLQLDGGNLAWHGSSSSAQNGILKYKMKTIGRAYTLAPRKAAPMPQSTPADGISGFSKTELHSPLSPLSPGSPIFPDGVFTPLWFAKHQDQVPALFLAFFNISASDSHNQDEQLKMDINAIRTALTRSGFKTRFAAILLSDSSIIQAPELEERLSSIRRLTSLDSKTGLFFMPPMSSQSEIAAFVRSLMTTLQPGCVEYYRELTKHARRKKAKGAPPVAPSASGGQSLSTLGWSVRYEAKQGVFAEFRQEMDVAERHYSAAIEDLFNAEGVFETTASWSPRWAEARLLCDCIALRVVRCQLWSSSTTAATKTWVHYKARMKDLVDRRGKGSLTYGWEAWEARWAAVMAQLIKRAALPSLQIQTQKKEEDSKEIGPQELYAPPEKAFSSSERLAPFHLLHHPGYWLKLAARSSRSRRVKALAISEEDQTPPEESRTSTAANKTENYDCYLVPEPHEEFELAQNAGDDRSHVSNITKLTNQSTEQFGDRGQSRMRDLMKFELAQDLFDVGSFEDAMQVLLPVWENTRWRDEDWRDVFAEFLFLVLRCARCLENVQMIVASTYELSSLAPEIHERVPDLNSCLEGMDLPKSIDTTTLKFRDRQRLCPVALSFAFGNKDTHVGDAIECQLSVASRTSEASESLTLSNITLSIGSKTVRIVHSPDAANASEDLVDLSVSEQSDNTLDARVNLTLRPGRTHGYTFRLHFREAEVFQLSQACISLDLGKIMIEHTFIDEAVLKANSALIKTDSGALERRFLPHFNTTSVTVLPKPPKVKVLVSGSKKEYYTDEMVRLPIEIVNEETDVVEGKINALSGNDVLDALPLQWSEEGEKLRLDEESQLSLGNPVTQAISQLGSGKSQSLVLIAKSPNEPLRTTVRIDVDYTLTTEPDTPLRKTLTLDLNIVTPFEARFNFGPLLYRDPWPTYFDAKDNIGNEDAGGIPQLWRLSSQVKSLASESLLLHNVALIVETVGGNSQASVSELSPVKRHSFGPGEIEGLSFQLLTQKQSLDDRSTTSLETTLAITWSHDEESESTVTQLPVPRLNLPVSEPKVLCTLADKQAGDHCDAILQYHIENPSTHFLTFAVTMEATEDFAFTGPKYRTLSLAPLSRHKVEYRIALHDQDDAQSQADEDGCWIWPSLQVIDSYYQKTLRVHPGGTGVKFDEKQHIGVWIATS